MKLLQSFIAPLLLAAILFSGCSKEKEQPQAKKSGIDTIAVLTSPVGFADIVLSKTFSGSIEGEEQANVTAKIPERITSIKVKVGDAVSPGDIVATLDKAGASSQYFQAEAAFLNAGKDLERMKALIKEGAISQQMLDGVQTQYTIAKANFEAVKSTVELTAPIGGIVTQINGRVGDNASPMMPLLSIAKISSLNAVFMVGENDIVYFAPEKNVSIGTEAKPEMSLGARVKEISKTADQLSRAFEVKARFTNTGDRWFKPGMFCKVSASLLNRIKALSVPNTALLQRGENLVVFVVVDGKAVQKPVRAGATDGVNTEILDGLSAGENLVTTGMAELKDGSPVRVQSK